MNRSPKTVDGFERDDIPVLLPQIVANWTITVTGEKPLPAEKQTHINQKLAELWCEFLEQNKEQWHSLGLTWHSHYLTTKQQHKQQI